MLSICGKNCSSLLWLTNLSVRLMEWLSLSHKQIVLIEKEQSDFTFLSGRYNLQIRIFFPAVSRHPDVSLPSSLSPSCSCCRVFSRVFPLLLLLQLSQGRLVRCLACSPWWTEPPWRAPSRSPEDRNLLSVHLCGAQLPCGQKLLSHLMEEVLINHIFDPLDFRLVCCCRKVRTFRVLIQELLVLWLEVFGLRSWRRVAVQQLALQGRARFNWVIKCDFWCLTSHSWRIITGTQMWHLNRFPVAKRHLDCITGFVCTYADVIL